MTQNIKKILNNRMPININIMEIKSHCEYEHCGRSFKERLYEKRYKSICKKCHSFMCRQCIKISGKHCLKCVNNIHKCLLIDYKYICLQCGQISCNNCTANDDECINNKNILPICMTCYKNKIIC